MTTEGRTGWHPCIHARIARDRIDDYGIRFDECRSCARVWIYGPNRVWLARRELREALAKRKAGTP